MFERLKRLYMSGRLTAAALRAAVDPNGWINAEQFEEITGEPF